MCTSIFLSPVFFLCLTTTTIALTLNPLPSLALPVNLTLPYHPLTAYDTPQCHLLTATPPMVGLHPFNCEVAAQKACNILASVPYRMLVREKWIWTNELPGCAVAYWLQEGQVVPNRRMCEGYFEQMIEKCGTNSSVNAGSVNVEVLPDFAQDGKPIIGREEMYLIAPERLTL